MAAINFDGTARKYALRAGGVVALACVLAAAAAVAWSAGDSLPGVAPARGAQPPRAGTPPPDGSAAAFIRAQASVTDVPPMAGDRANTVVAGPRMVYTASAPCRIVDTRTAGSGPVPADSVAEWVTVATDYGAQGGSVTSCGLDGVAVEAVMVNITAVFPATAGYATAYPAGSARPLAASLNYAAGAIVNNTVVAKVDTTSPARPFALYTHAQSHYVVDIVGYYTRETPGDYPLDCTDVTIDRYITSGLLFIENSTPARPSGYTIMSAQCKTSGSNSEGYEGQATINWSNNGLLRLDFPDRDVVACVGRDTVPSSVPGETVIQVVQHCCRVGPDANAPPP